MKELEVMLSGKTEERKQRIRDKADRLEVFFKDDVLYMKDKDEEWCDGMSPKETVGGVGLNVGYRINKSLVLEGQGTVNRSFDSSNYTGEVYTVGFTKTF